LCRAKDLEAARMRLINYCGGGLLAMVTADPAVAPDRGAL